MTIQPMVKVLAKKGESMIITDPKGEIYEKNALELKEKGYNIVLLNFRNPQNGNCWNPLTLPYVITSYSIHYTKLYDKDQDDRQPDIGAGHHRANKKASRRFFLIADLFGCGFRKLINGFEIHRNSCRGVIAPVRDTSATTG